MSDNVRVCIPTLNEEESIGGVVSDCISNGYENVLVIDGNSTDSTVQNAEDSGAVVHMQDYDGGKGAAMREAFDVTDEDILVFLDGDGTYEPSHIDRLVKPIEDGGYDHTIGNRFASMDDEAMKISHKIGNRGINLTFRIIYREDLVDILSGFRALKRSSFEDLDIKSEGFDIETELAAKSVRNGDSVLVVPTSYYKREGTSKLSGFRDGLTIVKRLFECRFRSSAHSS